MSKPIKRITEGAVIPRADRPPIGVVAYDADGRAMDRTARVISVNFNLDGSVSRLETTDTIYVQVKQ